jgi:hypothetical protein
MMRTWKMALKKLFVGDVPYPKGMSNSEFPSWAVNQLADIMNIVIVFQVTPPVHRVVKRNFELDIPFGYGASPTNNFFRAIFHVLIMVDMFHSHNRVIFQPQQVLTNFKF